MGQLPCPFVRDAQRVDSETRALVTRLLLERLSLRGICRVTGLSLTWLLQFIAALYERLPDDLCVAPSLPQRPVHLLRLEAAVDELWSFVGCRADKQWLWLAFDKESRQVLAFSVSDRSRESARKLWQRLPAVYRAQATFYSDDWEAYKGVIPAERHVIYGKESGLTSGVERFNCTLRQRVSRLVALVVHVTEGSFYRVGSRAVRRQEDQLEARVLSQPRPSEGASVVVLVRGSSAACGA
jgi:insertion element IS1 protein InsB